MKPNQVVISAWGASYGAFSEPELVNAAFQDHDISKEAYLHRERLPVFLPKTEEMLLGAHALKACWAMERAWVNASLWAERNTLRGKGDRFRHPRAAIVAGSSLGLISSALAESQKNQNKMHPYTLGKIRGNSMAAPLAIRFGLGAGDFSLSAASATGGQAVWLAAQLIQLNMADLVVVVGADFSQSCGFTQKALKAMGAVASSFSSRPLCQNRDGMRPVEASVALVLESEDHALKRGFKPLARWIGGAVKNDCYHLVAPQPQAQGLEEAVREVLDGNHSIDWLALHATGTKVWDSIELELVCKIFGNNTPHLSAFKRTFGHTLGSACLLSMAMVAEGLAHQRLPVLPQPIDPSFNLNLVNNPNIQARRAMNWSVGMGGTVAVNLFEACRDD